MKLDDVNLVVLDSISLARTKRRRLSLLSPKCLAFAIFYLGLVQNISATGDTPGVQCDVITALLLSACPDHTYFNNIPPPKQEKTRNIFWIIVISVEEKK